MHVSEKFPSTVLTMIEAEPTFLPVMVPLTTSAMVASVVDHNSFLLEELAGKIVAVIVMLLSLTRFNDLGEIGFNSNCIS